MYKPYNNWERVQETNLADGRPGHAAGTVRGVWLTRSTAMAVDPRTTSSGANRYSDLGAAKPLISSTSVRTAANPIAETGWRRVVSGGSVNAMTGESS
jgi:hypothetical protein